MHSGSRVQTSLWTGCPIRILKAHRLDAAPLERFVGLHVLHRPDAPRHPPRTLPRLSLLSGRTRPQGRSLCLPLLLFSLALGKIEVIIQSFSCSRCGWEHRCPHQLECGKPPDLVGSPCHDPVTHQTSCLHEDRPGIDARLSISVPRKEVIQPHLPVRLPCYDFTPIIDPTFDGSLLKG